MNSGLRVRRKKKMLNTYSRMKQSDKIYLAGHSGLVGSALVRLLKARAFNNLITRSRAEVDLRNEQAVRDFFAEERPDLVILAAARVGGIKANIDAPVEFLIENLQIQNNVIRAAHEAGARKLLFLGSSCIYPKFAPQPIPESALLSGPLEPTNEPYAIAKIAGVKLCQAFAREHGANFISVLPTNLSGTGDAFVLRTQHALAALVRKAHGTPRKLLDISKIKKLGWQPTISLRDGVARFYEWFLDNYVPQSMASVR